MFSSEISRSRDGGVNSILNLQTHRRAERRRRSSFSRAFSRFSASSSSTSRSPVTGHAEDVVLHNLHAGGKSVSRCSAMMSSSGMSGSRGAAVLAARAPSTETIRSS